MYKVFLVEDDIIVREGMRDCVPWDTTAYTFAGEAADGEMALLAIKDIQPDILITDVKMPFMDGLALSRIVKMSMPWVKIVILSGHDEFEYAREAISIGIDEYLLKPVSPKDILGALDKLARKIDCEKEALLNMEHLKQQVQSHEDALKERWFVDFGSGKLLDAKVEGTKAAEEAEDAAKADAKAAFGVGASAGDALGEAGQLQFAGIDSDILLTRFRYAEKSEIDSIIGEYARYLRDKPGENELLEHYILSEVFVNASKIIEELHGNVNEVLPFSLNWHEIKEILASEEVFYEKIREIFNVVIEFRDLRTGNSSSATILKAKAYIDKHFSEESLSLNTVASNVYISPNYLSTIFAQETGEKFIEYLTRARIERAKYLLKNTVMKSADIAYEIGFSDPHYFSVIFKKHSGLSPREYRGQGISKK
jgi:two-component system response regulator YesN